MTALVQLQLEEQVALAGRCASRRVGFLTDEACRVNVTVTICFL